MEWSTRALCLFRPVIYQRRISLESFYKHVVYRGQGRRFHVRCGVYRVLRWHIVVTTLAAWGQLHRVLEGERKAQPAAAAAGSPRVRPIIQMWVEGWGEVSSLLTHLSTTWDRRSDSSPHTGDHTDAEAAVP